MQIMHPPNVIFIPGFMCDGLLFSPQIEAMRDKIWRGVACTNNYETITNIAAQILETALERFTLAGLSMGGIIALEVFNTSTGACHPFGAFKYDTISGSVTSTKAKTYPTSQSRTDALCHFGRLKTKIS